MKNISLIFFVFSMTIGYAQTKKEQKIIDKAVKEITVKKDDFDNTITWSSPLMGKGLYSLLVQPIQFTKIKDKNGKYFTYLSLTSYGSTMNVGEKGLVLLFEDGTRFERPNAKISCDYDSGSSVWRYSTFELISDEELKLFTEKKVDKYKLYIYEGLHINNKFSLKAMGYAKGIEQAK